jgi:uncharacterized protein YdcH (DUF465 family)
LIHNQIKQKLSILIQNQNLEIENIKSENVQLKNEINKMNFQKIIETNISQ